MSSLVKDIQDEAVTYLAAVTALAGVPIIGRRQKNIVNDVAAAIQRLGVCIYVFPPLPLSFNSNNPGPYVEKLACRFRVHEHPAINQTLPDAYELVELLARHLDCKQFTAVDGLNPLWWAENPVTFEQDDNLVIFDLHALTSCGLTPRD